ncbi:hypothetical protein LWI29_008222 [Acer saccharum]|uniref:Uncharacterized protein n=1 Tax=Acer saccharum TaxID=4024 RepID=A0AA39VQA1_ACESA|nr:hypothetical protein LWI29_008222 [Acer saccharum]
MASVPESLSFSCLILAVCILTMADKSNGAGYAPAVFKPTQWNKAFATFMVTSLHQKPWSAMQKSRRASIAFQGNSYWLWCAEAADQGIKSARVLDLVIRDYTFKSFNNHFRTGTFHDVNLPANLSGIEVDTARFRCGSLRRYGARVKEFHLGIGITVQPCVERVMVVRQNLGHNWSSIYYANYDLSGYQLVSPVLGLLAYNAGSGVNFNNRFELGILANEKPITIDFRNMTTITNVSGIKTLCANFQKDVSPPPEQVVKRKISRWKLVVGTTVGSAVGAFLLGLLLVAMFVKVKKKARMEELERRAYEEEALQVSMVGHIRAPTASVTRTSPTIEHEYLSYPS